MGNAGFYAPCGDGVTDGLSLRAKSVEQPVVIADDDGKRDRVGSSSCR